MLTKDYDYYELPAEPIYIRRRVSKISTGMPEDGLADGSYTILSANNTEEDCTELVIEEPQYLGPEDEQRAAEAAVAYTADEEPTKKPKSKKKLPKYRGTTPTSRKPYESNFSRFHNDMLRNPEIKPHEKIVYLLLDSYVFNKSGVSGKVEKDYCYVSPKRLAHEASMGLTKLYECLRTLEDNGLIERYKDNVHPSYSRARACIAVRHFEYNASDFETTEETGEGDEHE